MIFENSKVLLLYEFNQFIPTICWEPFTFGHWHNEFNLLKVIFNWKLGAKLMSILFFRFVCSQNCFNNQMVAVTLRSIPKCYKKVLEGVSTGFFCGTNCYHSWEQKESFNEELKNNLKNSFLNKTSTKCQILNQKNYNISDFEIEKLQRARFRNFVRFEFFNSINNTL